MGKLHQLLAVEESHKTTFKKLVDEGIDTFSKKPDLFKGVSSTQNSMVDQKADPIKYKEYPDITETVPVAENVQSKLNYIFEAAMRYFDISAQKDAANQNAKADLIVRGQTLISGVPATTLLFIENKMKFVRSLLESIKTLDPAKVWTHKEGENNIYKAADITKMVKEPVERHKVVVQATEKHPAQIAKEIDHEVRATKTITELSGLITPSQKSDLMRKCDELINSAKVARQKANDVEHGNNTIGKQIFDYLMS